MNKKRDLVKKYRDNNQEIELIESLGIRGVREYNNEYKSLIEVLFLMLDETEKNHLIIQQVLFEYILRALEEILKSKETCGEFVGNIITTISLNNANVPDFISRFILKILEPSLISKYEHIEFLNGALENVNVEVLKKAITEQKDFDLIIALFYSCVTDIGLNRKVILHPEAINEFRKYIDKNPLEYLRCFLRPYYHGFEKDFIDYFEHIGEPFCKQIFQEDNEFISFLDGIKPETSDIKLVQDIKRCFEKTNFTSMGINKTIVLFSLETPPSSNQEQFIKLLSKKHKLVRPECLPPDYKAQ